MKLFKNHTWLIALSQIGFALLITFWLYNSYQNKKRDVQREATFFFGEQSNILQKEKWQRGLKVFFEKNLDSIGSVDELGDTTINLGNISFDRPRGRMRGFLKTRTNPNDSLTITNTFEQDSLDLADTIENSVIRIYRGAGKEKETIFLGTIPDSNHLVQLKARLDTAALHNNFSLEPMSIEEYESRTDGFFITRAPGRRGENQMVIAEIKNYKPYLFRKVLPEGLLSLFLLGLSGLAFWQLGKALRTQRLMAEQQQNFMYNMTHELKTPVTTIGLAMESLKNNNLTETSKEQYIDLSTKSVHRLSTLIDKVLGAAKLQNGKLQLSSSMVNVGQLVEEVVETHNFMLKEQGKAFQVIHQRSGHNMVLVGDAYHIRNAISNLIDNAIKYSSEAPEIKVKAQCQNGKVEVAVTDNGPGIDKENLPFLFKKFYRVNDGRQHNVKGFGLGLHYTNQVAHLHGGTLDVVSVKDQGSTFTLKLPSHG